MVHGKMFINAKERGRQQKSFKVLGWVSLLSVRNENPELVREYAPNKRVKPTHFRGASFVADATSLTPLQWSAYPKR